MSNNVPAPSAEMTRILQKEFADTEEVRYEVPSSLVGADIYIGVAADGTATSATDWNVVRVYFDANENPTRARIQLDISWDDRASGW